MSRSQLIGIAQTRLEERGASVIHESHEKAEAVPLISNWEADVLQHTSRTGRYVTGEARVIELGERGLLHDYGAQRLAAGAHYFTLTGRGRAELDRWQAAQPKPKPVKRKRSGQAFVEWRAYRDAACDNVTFTDWYRRKKEWETSSSEISGES